MARRIIFALMACVLVSGALFAGGGRQAASGPQQIVENPNFNRTGYPIVKDKITVRSALLRVIDNIPRVTWQRVEEVTNIKVEFFGVDPQQIATFMAAGEWPDFFHSNLNRGYVNDHGVLGKQLVDYRNLLQYMPHLQKTFTDYPISKKMMTEIDGAIYQLPLVEIQTTSNMARFHYRSDNLRKYGLKDPTTIDEFYEVLVGLKNATGNAHWVSIIDDIEQFHFPSFGSYLDPDFDAEGNKTVVFNRTSEQYKRFLTFLNKCYAEGLLHREFLTLDEATKLSMGKQAVFTFGNGASLLNLTEADFPSGNFDIGTPKPFLSQWNNATKVKGRLGMARAQGSAINAKSKYIPEIARMLDIAYATEEVVPGTGLYGVAWVYGPEGYSWHFTSPAKEEMSFWIPPQHPDVTSHSVMQWERNVMLENLGARADFGQAITAEKSNNRVRQIGYRDNINPNMLIDYFPGGPGAFNSLHFTPEEQAVLDSRYTDVDAYVKEMRAKFITGVSNIEAEWAAYTKVINDMGIADIVKIYQAAYDRWNQI